MADKPHLHQVDKLKTGVTGLDFIAQGGIPKNRTTLVTGTAGSAKTVFAAQFLVEGVLKGQGGVFVTFEETPEAIRSNMAGFGWDIVRFEQEGRWAFVDASAHHGEETIITGDFDLGAFLARIEHAVKKVNAARVSIDSIDAVFTRFGDRMTVRNELLRTAAALRLMEVTSIITSERTEDYGSISRNGVEEFVADNVIILRNVLDEENRRRTVEILKFRGAQHHKGEFPFTVRPQEGISVIPLAAMELTQRSSNVRISSGSQELDKMCGGGFFRDSIILVSGATGTGKTLMTTEFIHGGCHAGEKALLFAFEESREQLFRNATGWGVDFRKMEKDGLLKVVCDYPESSGLEDHLIVIKEVIEKFKPNRVAVDSLSALERVSTGKSFREFVIGLTSFIKHQEFAGLFTSTTPTLTGGASVTEAHISTLTDSIILLRYVEIFGSMRRGLTILKMRGSMHDKEIREFTIDGDGMHLGKPFRNVGGIMAGNPVQYPPAEMERLARLFPESMDL